jgi:hypothetical protein
MEKNRVSQGTCRLLLKKWKLQKNQRTIV